MTDLAERVPRSPIRPPSPSPGERERRAKVKEKKQLHNNQRRMRRILTPAKNNKKWCVTFSTNLAILPRV